MKVKVTLVERVEYEWLVDLPDENDEELMNDYIVQHVYENEDFSRGECIDAEWEWKVIKDPD